MLGAGLVSVRRGKPKAAVMTRSELGVEVLTRRVVQSLGEVGVTVTDPVQEATRRCPHGVRVVDVEQGPCRRVGVRLLVTLSVDTRSPEPSCPVNEVPLMVDAAAYGLVL